MPLRDLNVRRNGVTATVEFGYQHHRDTDRSREEIERSVRFAAVEEGDGAGLFGQESVAIQRLRGYWPQG